MTKLKLSVYCMNGWFLNTFMKTAYEWIVHTLYIVHVYLHSTELCTLVHVCMEGTNGSMKGVDCQKTMGN